MEDDLSPYRADRPKTGRREREPATTRESALMGLRCGRLVEERVRTDSKSNQVLHMIQYRNTRAFVAWGLLGKKEYQQQ